MRWDDPASDPLADILALKERLASPEYQQAHWEAQREHARWSMRQAWLMHHMVVCGAGFHMEPGKATCAGCGRAMLHDKPYGAEPPPVARGPRATRIVLDEVSSFDSLKTEARRLSPTLLDLCLDHPDLWRSP